MQNMIGHKVRQARLSHKPKVTQQQLTARLQLLNMKIDRAGVAKIENGLRQVTDVELMKLAEALGVSAAWLLGETHDR